MADEDLLAPLTPEDLADEMPYIASAIRQIGGQINSALVPGDQKTALMLARSQLLSVYAVLDMHRILTAGEAPTKERLLS